MEPVPCLGCSVYFVPRNKSQQYCSDPRCQKKRKAEWQKKKMRTDQEYREAHKLSHQKWLSNNPGYWREYRQRKPEKAQRNRDLQKVRNKRVGHSGAPPNLSVIAKMDARNPLPVQLAGEFWLVPTIAKMDAAKINFRIIPVS